MKTTKQANLDHQAGRAEFAEAVLNILHLPLFAQMPENYRAQQIVTAVELYCQAELSPKFSAR